MPCLKHVLSCTAGQTRLCRICGKVTERISSVGLSFGHESVGPESAGPESVDPKNVGPEKFGPDIVNVVDILVRTSALMSEDPDRPQSYYLMQSHDRICRCPNDEFIKYFPHVMHRLLKAATQKPDIQLLELGYDDDGQDGSAEEYKTVTIGGSHIGIRTSVLVKKTAACSMLACFIAELEDGFKNTMKRWPSS